MTTRQVRSLLAVTAALVTMTFAVAPASAQDQCAGLDSDAAAAYNELALAAVTSYTESQFKDAIAKNKEALELCDEDPNLFYNLARAYHKDNDCHMALYFYEEVIDEMPRKRQKKMKAYMSELEPICGASVVAQITCEDGDIVTVEVGDRQVECPWVGRVDPGDYTLTATAEEHRDWEGSFTVVSEGENMFTVPALVRNDAFGNLAVTCGPEVQNFKLIYPDGNEEELPCPWDGELETGSYTLSTHPEGTPVATTVVGAQTTSVDALATPPPSSCACSSVATTTQAPLGMLLTGAGLFMFGLVIRRRI